MAVDATWTCVSIKAGAYGLRPEEAASQLALAAHPTLDATPAVLACIDGRESRRVHGTPGGDLGEFLLALSVVDDATGGAYLTTEEVVTELLATLVQRKGAFYFATDERAVDALEGSLRHVGFSLAAATEAAAGARGYAPSAEVLDAVCAPEHIGCRPVRACLENAAVYGVRAHVARWAVRSAYRLLWTREYAARMQLTVFSGAPDELGVLHVQTLHPVAPWREAQALVLHPAAVQLARRRCAFWLAAALRADPRAHVLGGRADAEELLAAMNARGRTQLELTLDALAPNLPHIGARCAAARACLYALGPSANCAGAALLLRELGAIEAPAAPDAAGGLKSEAFGRLNPFHKVPTLHEPGGVSIGESSAILRHGARAYGAEQLYPARSQPGLAAQLDSAMDAFAFECYLPHHKKVVYPLMGFAPPPDDALAEAAAYEAALGVWAERFLRAEGGRFIGGSAEPTIADFKVVPFLLAATHAHVAQAAGLRAHPRLSQLVADFVGAVPLAAATLAPISEWLDAKEKEHAAAGGARGGPPRARTAPPATPAAASTATTTATATPSRGTATGGTAIIAHPAGRAPAAAVAGLLLGQLPPDFVAESTHGRIRLHELLGRGGWWTALFSHPDDFTPVCTTELGSVAQLLPQFSARKVRVLALSCNTTGSHIAWGQDVLALARLPTDRGFPYPIIADPTREIATAFGMLDGTNPQEGMPLTCRAVFVFGPDKTLKLQLLYPASSGRNFGEVLRAIDSLQMTAVHKVATPANWMPGKPCMVLPALSDEAARAALPKGFQTQAVPSGRRYIRVTPDPAL